MRFSTGSFVAGYFVLGRLGEGTVSSVYRVFDEDLGREAALKLTPTELARDVSLLRSLRHPNLLPIHGSGSVQGHVWFLTELLEGGTLRRLIGEPMRLRDAVRLLAPLASALDHAHQHGLLNAAIRPENVRLTGAGVPVLAGFETVDISGSPDYMSPERCLGEAPTTWSDLYSLGVIAYELLTGRLPFIGTPAEIAAAQVTAAPARSGLEPWLEATLTRALAKNPTARFGTGAEFISALEERAPAPAGPEREPGGLFGRLRLRVS